DRLLAALGIARAQRRGEDLLQQRRLAVGRRAEDAQVAPADAVARELGDGADDLALGLVEVRGPGPRLALDDAVLLELLDQRRIGARLLEDVLERVQRAPAAHRHARAPRTAPLGGLGHLAVLLRASARELLADDAQRQELVALQAQDRAQALHVGRRVEAVAAGCAPRREELLVLEVADLGDRDVGELLRERLADRPDGHRLAARRALVDLGKFDVGHRQWSTSWPRARAGQAPAPLAKDAGRGQWRSHGPDRGRTPAVIGVGQVVFGVARWATTAGGRSACTCRSAARRRPRGGATRSAGG